VNADKEARLLGEWLETVTYDTMPPPGVLPELPDDDDDDDDHDELVVRTTLSPGRAERPQPTPARPSKEGSSIESEPLQGSVDPVEIADLLRPALARRGLVAAVAPEPRKPVYVNASRRLIEELQKLDLSERPDE